MDPIINVDPKAVELIQWGFYSLITGCAVIVTNTMITMKNSIVSLNEKVAAMLETQSWHGREIERVDRRIDRIEERHN